jgi:hypothetical protein
MSGWQARWHTVTSFLICAVVMLLGTLLYPLVLLFFSGISLVYPLYRRLNPSGNSFPPGGPQGEAGR